MAASPAHVMFCTLIGCIMLNAPTHGALSNVITDWIYQAQAAVRTTTNPGASNQLATRMYSIVGAAQARAIRTAKDRPVRGGKPYGKPVANIIAAAAFASHNVLSVIFPQRQTAIFDPFIAAQLAQYTKAQLDAAEKVGVAAAQSVLAERLGDGFARWYGYVDAGPNKPDGVWVFTPGVKSAQFPQLGATKPFAVSSIGEYDKLLDLSQYKPYSVNSQQFATELQEVYLKGNKTSPTRSDYDSKTPIFWAGGAGTHGNIGHYLNITYGLLPASTSVEEIALFTAHATAAAWDSSIVGYYLKYQRLFWRPITPIRKGFKAGASNPYWTPLLDTPGHPEYTSGHSHQFGAFARIYERLYRDKKSFSTFSENDPTLPPRTYANLDAAVNEGGESRIFGGIHYRKAILDGKAIGRRVADIVFARYKP